MKPKALIFSTVEGHASIAEAIATGLKQHDWQVKIATHVDPSFHFYKIFYRYAPSLFSLIFQTLSRQSILKLVNKYTQHTHSEAVHQDTDDYEPDVIISTWSGFDSSIGCWRENMVESGEVPPAYINVVADPWTFSPGHLSESADVNCFFDDQSINRCRELEVSPRAVITGWFVRPQFRIDQSKKNVRRQLKLDEDILTLLFVAGSEGEIKSSKLIPELLELSEQPLQIILACGSNRLLKAKFDHFAAELPPDSPHRFICLPFTKKLHTYVQAADLMIGKAGPNSIFEAVAAETPFFATTHISGQEDGNLDLIRDYSIGYVEEDLSNAEAMLLQIIAKPTLLKQFDQTIKKLAKYNDDSIERLLAVIKQLLP